MKLIIVFAVISCFTTLCADTWTDPDTGINWTYTLIDEGVSLGDGFYGPPAVPGTTKGKLIIPDKIKGKSVVNIGDYAFAGCAGLTSVTIPNGVRSIGDYAFDLCQGLTSVMIPSSVSSLGEAAFLSCNALESVSIPSSVTKVGRMAFRNCYGLSSVTISEGVQCVDDYAFGGCSGLTILNIPATVTRVGKNAFNGCEKLRSNGVIVIDGCLVDIGNVSGAFTIPTGVRLIADAVFVECSGFASLTIPATVTSIGRRAFAAWKGLLAIDFEGAPPTGVVDAAINQDAVVRYNSQYANDWLPVIAQCDWSNASPYTLGTPADPLEYKQPDGGPYQEIVDGVVWTFKVSDGIATVTGASPSEGSLTVPIGLGGRPVANIGDSAFLRCRGLTAVTIPSGVTRIGDSAFYECSSLASVKMPNTLTHIGVNAFNSCKMLSLADIPPNVTSIGNSAFYDCCRLDDLEIPATMTSIGKSVFSGCYGLESVVIPSSVTNVSYSAFEGCWGLKHVTIPACVAGSRLSYTFRDAYTEIEEVVICDGATRIGWAAFEDCSCLTSVTVPSTVTCIDNYAFEDCSRLTAVSIPPGVTNIGEHAFWNCEGLHSVNIPSKLTHIGKSAFYGCKGLGHVNISDLAAWCGIEFEDENANPLSKAGHLYLNGQEVVTLTLPSGVERIGDYAFIRCLDLSNVTIPSGVKSIGYQAFSNCSRMTSVSIPSSVTSIGYYAFDGCGMLNHVYVSKGDVDRVKGLYDWPSNVEFVEIVIPTVDDDPGAAVTGDPISGFIIKPSAGNTVVEVTIPQGVDAAKVTVEVSPKVATVKPNGAMAKVVVGNNDITDCLVIPESDGVMNIAAATVKEEIAKETLDPSKDAVIDLNAANPQLITAPTRKGLTYTLFEGHKLESLSKGDSIIGNGDPWKPTITVSGGDAAFYSIDVSK